MEWNAAPTQRLGIAMESGILREMVDQNSASWNQVMRWLRVVSALARQDPDSLYLAGTPGYQIV